MCFFLYSTVTAAPAATAMAARASQSVAFDESPVWAEVVVEVLELEDELEELDELVVLAETVLDVFPQTAM